MANDGCLRRLLTFVSIVTAGQIAYPDYVPQTWHIYLTLLALLIMQGLVTMQSTWFIGCRSPCGCTPMMTHINRADECPGVNKVGTIANVIIILIFVIWFPVGSINSPKTNNSHAVSRHSLFCFARGTHLLRIASGPPDLRLLLSFDLTPYP